jgi:hypothetical protein
VRRVLAEQGARWGDSGRAGADGRPAGMLRSKERFAISRLGGRVYDGAVFAVKKEIPDGLSVLFHTRDIEAF